jgi:hypothetical protein
MVHGESPNKNGGVEMAEKENREQNGVEKLAAAMVAAWRSPVVARIKSEEFSGGLVNPRTLANCDCLGTGPAGRFRVGKKICYPATSLAAWIFERARPVEQ